MTQHSSLSNRHPAPYRRTVHAVALFAAAVTLPLLMTGAQVTTNRFGMAVPDWPTTFGINMFLYNMAEASYAVFVEHRHRLFGSSLGIATIILAAWFVLADRRRWMKLLGVGALLAVIGQGSLGGIRVLRNSTTFAAIHGCTGQLVFALLVALCVLTSRDWLQPDAEADDPGSLRRRSAVNLGLIYGQIVIGATLRHFGANLLFHAVLAVAVLAHAVALWIRVERSAASVPWLVKPARWMAMAVAVQVLLGIAAWWLLRPFDGIPRLVTTPQSLARTGHVVNGALFLASAVVLTLRAFRHLRSPEVPNRELVRQGAVEVVA